MPKLLALDGNSLLHRAFHALPLLTNSEGVYTNAVYGFLNMYFKVVEEENPDYLAVAFDVGKPAVRIKEYSAYKGQRPPTAVELRGQFDLIKEILRAMQVHILEDEGYEADDLLGSLAKKAESTGLESVLVTGDKDLLQLASEKTRIRLCRKGIAETEDYDPQAVEDKYTLKPGQIPDLKGLMGDNSDNIPGVPGVGEKTAIKLLNQYGSVEGVLEHIPEIKGKKLPESLENNKELAILCKKLATIITDRPIDLKACAIKEYDESNLKAIFQRLELKTFLKKMMENSRPVVAENIEDRSVIEKIKEEIKNAGKMAFLLELSALDDMKAELLGITLAWEDKRAALRPEDLDLLSDILSDEKVKKYTYDLKSQLLYLWQKDIKVSGVTMDIMLASYLLDPDRKTPTLDELATENLLNEQKAGAIYLLQDILLAELDKQEMSSLLVEVEMPLVDILAGMEYEGIALNTEYLKTLSSELEEQLNGLEERIYFQAGERFNINSPKQLGVILFERLQLPAGKKTKTGYSTNADVLEFLRDKHPIIEEILAYRQLTKLKSTYVDALPKLLNDQTNRLHTCLNQAVTATGRLSSSNPNLQNIPAHGEWAKKIREAFITDKSGTVLLSADYSQIELRVLAHISGDENLCQAFCEEQDIHAKTASEVFNLPLAEVDPEMRSKAKAVNFGIVYGISDFGLAKNIQVSQKEAKQYIANYLERYPKVKAYMSDVVREGKALGYVTTILKRRRYLPDLNNKNHLKSSFAGRAAINTPIQGSAADIIKLAMIKIDGELKKEGLQTKMLLQVHDELIFEVPDNEVDKVKAIVQENMNNVIEMAVPLKVGLAIGSNWAELK